MLSGETRKEFGHVWSWQPEGKRRGHWQSTDGNLVRVFPPSDSLNFWYVTICDAEQHRLTGSNVEQRAFCIAEVYTRQDRTARAD